MSHSLDTQHSARLSWKAVLGYLALLIGGIVLFLLIRSVGSGLTAPPTPPDSRPVGQLPLGQVDVLSHVIATLAMVVGLGCLLGQMMKAIGQPAVIGEILAGILLGPSFLGAISPEAMHLLIPSATVDPHGQVAATLKVVAHLGVILYMFLVGLEMNAARLAKQAHASIAVSHASIVVPFVLGALLALGLYPIYSHAGVPFTTFAMFLGVAMAITAFPVLARILSDRGMEKSELGEMALSCAAADDVTAWCLLALTVGIARSDVGQFGSTFLGAMVFVALMFLGVRPLLARSSRVLESDTGTLPPLIVSGMLLGVLCCSLMTEAIGIHALFGAFLFGALVPHDSRLARELTEKLKVPVMVMLLPAFFAYTGMRTQINLVQGWENWFWCGAIIVIATLGKFGGTLFAARLTGTGWKDAAALGALMNTRGLMELIVLNLGLDLGIISPTLFAMIVLMALATTVMTSPILSLLERK